MKVKDIIKSDVFLDVYIQSDKGKCYLRVSQEFRCSYLSIGDDINYNLHYGYQWAYMADDFDVISAKIWNKRSVFIIIDSTQFIDLVDRILNEVRYNELFSILNDIIKKIENDAVTSINKNLTALKNKGEVNDSEYRYLISEWDKRYHDYLYKMDDTPT